jgi:hypothetical protein
MGHQNNHLVITRPAARNNNKLPIPALYIDTRRIRYPTSLLFPVFHAYNEEDKIGRRIALIKLMFYYLIL